MPFTIAMCLGPTIGVCNVLGIDSVSIGGVISPFQLFNGLLLVAMVMALPKGSLRVLAERNLLTPLFLLALYAVGTAAFWMDPFANVAKGLHIMFLYVMFVSALEFSRCGLLGQGWFRTIPWVVLGLLVFSQVCGHLLGLSERSDEYALALTGISDDPSLVGVIAVSILPWFLVFSERRMVNIVGCIAVLAVCLVSFRRSACAVTVVLLCGMFVYQVSRAGRLGWKLRVTAVFAAACIGGVVFAYHASMGQAFAHRLEGLNVFDGGTASGRTEFQVLVVNHLASRDVTDSVFGEGVGASGDVIEAGWDMRIGAHNAWLDMTTAFGAIGCFLLVWFHVNVVRLCVASQGTRRVAALGVAGVVCVGGGIMNGMYGPYHGPIYVFLGVLCAGGMHWRGGRVAI